MDIKVSLLANSEELKRRGLSLIKHLPENNCAVFVYNEDVNFPFWNKGVKYPIDIGFYDKDYKLVYKTSLEAEQLSPVFCPTKYRYVVEMNLGKLDLEDISKLDCFLKET